MAKTQQNSSNFNAFEANPFSYNPFKDLKIPLLDIDTAMATHRKNIEALNAAQQAMTEAMRSLFQIQTQFSKQWIEDLTNYSRNLSNPTQPQNYDHHTQAWRHHCDAALAHGRQVLDTVAESHKKVGDLVHKRLSECLDESRDLAQTAAPSSSGSQAD